MAKSLATPPAGQLREIVTELEACARDRSVLEVACGTGYWTRFAAPCSSHLVAADFSAEMLGVAIAQAIAGARFCRADAYGLESLGADRFDFGFAMHWVSHIPLSRWDEFFRGFHARLKPRAKVMLADDIRRPDDTDPYYSKLETRDSYEIRRLPNGETYEIVKTYFTPDELRALLQPYAANLIIRYERPRWWLTYDAKT
jgi:SAM-dependent methyltransferase